MGDETMTSQPCPLCGTTVNAPDTTCPDCGDPVCWCDPPGPECVRRPASPSSDTEAGR
jgi:hypothetical protein